MIDVDHQHRKGALNASEIAEGVLREGQERAPVQQAREGVPVRDQLHGLEIGADALDPVLGGSDGPRRFEFHVTCIGFGGADPSQQGSDRGGQAQHFGGALDALRHRRISLAADPVDRIRETRQRAAEARHHEENAERAERARAEADKGDEDREPVGTREGRLHRLEGHDDPSEAGVIAPPPRRRDGRELVSAGAARDEMAGGEIGRRIRMGAERRSHEHAAGPVEDDDLLLQFGAA